MKAKNRLQNLQIATVTLLVTFLLGMLASGCTLSQAEALRTIQSVQGTK